MSDHPQALTALLAALVIAIAGTAFAEGAVPEIRVLAAKRGNAKAPRPPKHRRAPAVRTSPALTRALIDREIRRLGPSLRVGKSDYSNTTNIANRAALADQATTADQANGATNANRATTAGSAPLSAVSYRTSTVAAASAVGTLVPATAGCPPDQKVVGGGVSLTDSANVYVNDAGPSGQSGWKAHAYVRSNTNPGSSMTVTAICVPVAP